MNKTRNVCTLFNQQVIQQSQKIAVYYSGTNTSLTYQTLDEQSNYLANCLLSQDQNKSNLSNNRVIVFIEKSTECIVSILSVLKSGGCYVPVDIDYPAERLKKIIDTLQPSYILTTTEAWKSINSNVEILSKIIFVDALLKNPFLLGFQGDEHKVEISETDLAYIIFTSGSTGTPKGVMIEHKNLLASLLARAKSYPEQNKSCLLFPSIGFDSSITAIFWPLLQGGTLVIPEQLDSKNPAKIAHLIEQHHITHLPVTPSFYDLLLDQNTSYNLNSLERVIVAGEQTQISLVKKHKKYLPNTTLTNEYGPTEASVWSTTTNLYDAQTLKMCDIVTIGQSAPHAQNYILNEVLGEVRAGEAGEIYIAGEGVGRGYLGASEKDTNSFIHNLLITDKTNHQFHLQKAYKTGDIAKYLPSGEIVFIGRQDNQIKLRGQRIELTEIEAVLQSYETVKQAIVRKNNDADQLIAYITITSNPETFDISALHTFASKKLPEYMLPSQIIILENFPLNQHGKIDTIELLKYSQITHEIPAKNDIKKEINDICNIFIKILNNENVTQNDNFFKLGGHSLLVVKAVIEINKTFNSAITIREFYSNPTASEIAEIVINSEVNIPLHPLSYAQERMWFLHKYSNGKDQHYNVAFSITFLDQLNISALEKSLGKIIERHEIYRTIFIENEEGVFQKILPHKKFILNQEKIETKNDLNNIITKEISKNFNLESDQLIKLKLFSLNTQHHILLVNQHHIVHDGWSIRLFQNELSSLYQSYIKGGKTELPNLPIQYKDFAQIQREPSFLDKLDSQVAYWTSRLENVPQLNLPTDHARPLVQTYNGAHYLFPIPPALFQTIRALASKLNLTTYTVLLSAFCILLSRYSNQKDIVTGIVVTNRDQENIQNIIGLFINTLALRVQIKDDSINEDFLLEVRDILFDALMNKDIPFEYIINKLNLPRTTDKQPIFQSMFIYDYIDDDSLRLNLPGIKTVIQQEHNNTSKHDFSFNLQESSSDINVLIEYNTDIYYKKTITNMASHFTNLLEEITSNPQKNINELNFITSEEQDLIINQWNNPPTSFDEKYLVHELFEKQTKLAPNNPAVFCGDGALTYEELNTESNKLAHYLYKIGIAPEETIAVAIHRSLDLPIILMAIFKVGAGYVPLDPNYPKVRLQYMLENSNAKILITEDDILADFKLKTSGEIILVKNIKELIQKESGENLNLRLNEKNLALIHYTSGSTGKPKGVILEHDILCQCFKWLQSIYKLGSNDRTLQHTLYSFDIFICELFWPLTFGSSSVLVEPDDERNTSQLIKLIKKHKIKTIFCVPSMLALFLENEDFTQCVSLENILSTGEALPIELKDLFYERSAANLYNLYGPTEAIITSYEYCKPTEKFITIGRPVDDKQIFILDKRKALQPVGVPGELCISGKIARGYHNMPELSSEKFFTHIINSKTYKLYNTGDVARYLHDGRIEYLGRSDFQIKLHGHRIELTEIETYLNKYNDIEKCVIDLKKHNGDDLLVAYYTSRILEKEISTNSLRDYLIEYFPHYMIPSFFIRLDCIPLTPSGKIDRKALPELTEEHISHTSTYIAPRNDFEFKLVKILESLLNVNKISIHDDFFQIGGTSLLAVRFILSIKNKFSKTIPFSLLFKNGTIAEISKYLDLRPSNLISQTIFPIHEGKGKCTLFFIHPVEGLSYLYTPLASHLRAHSLYGLNNPYFYEQDKAFNSIEDMASHYVKAINTIQPKGPYYLCGWSSGGQVAHEMALQLKKQNQDVAAVIFLDTYHKSIKVEPEDLNIRIPRVLKSEGIDPESEEGSYFTREYKRNISLLQKYPMKHYDGRIILIKAQDVDKNIEDDLYNGWQPYVSSQIEVYSVPGEHGRLLDLEYIENLSSILDKILRGDTNAHVFSDTSLIEIDKQLCFSIANKDPYLINRCLLLGANIEIMKQAQETVE